MWTALARTLLLEVGAKLVPEAVKAASPWLRDKFHRKTKARK